MLIDIISVPWWGLLRHCGLRVTTPDGSAFVYANAPGIGVVRQTAAGFANGRPITVSPALTRLHPLQVVARAERMLHRRYDLFSWNCEHFVTSALGKKPESAQLQNILLMLAGALALSRLAS